MAGAKENAADGLPTRYTALGYVTDYSYDSLNRLTKRNVDLDNDIQTLYYYKNADLRQGYTTSQISSENLDGTTYAYTYDNMGNITEIKKNGNAYREYSYDDLGQLTIECQYDNKQMLIYGYNHLGNIVTKDIFTYSDTALTNKISEQLYEYRYGDDNKDGWNYLLTSYDENNNGTVDDNEKISYDKIGNPIVYRGAEMAWKGRQLTGYAKNGTMSTFTYDADGLRATKTVGGIKTIYQYVGDKLYYEKRGDSQEFYYFYDSYGKLATIYYGTSTSRAIYHTLTNAQGDVIAIYNNTGALVARYEYDAWGNILSVKDANGNPITQQNHIANANPIRYRGYYYDSDLGLYYLQSRYYDSETGRFLNSDNVSDSNSGVLGYNTYIYASNNPIKFSDPSGHSIILSMCLSALVGAAVSAVSDIGCQLLNNGFETSKMDWNSVAYSALVGGIFGCISGGVGGAIAKSGAKALTKTVATAVADGCINVAETAFDAVCRKRTLSAGDIVYSFSTGATSSFLGSVISNSIQKGNISKFNSLTNNQKKITLNSHESGQHVTRNMLNNDEYLRTTAYQSYISSGTVFAEQASSGALIIFFNLFEEAVL